MYKTAVSKLQNCTIITKVYKTAFNKLHNCTIVSKVYKTAVSKLQNCTIVTKVYKTAVNKLQNWPMNKDGITYVKVNIVNIIFCGNIECLNVFS